MSWRVNVLLPGDEQPTSREQDWRQTAWKGALLILLTVAAYLPVFRAGFIWDDDAHVTQNPCVVGPLGLKGIWTSRAARICPLVQTTFRAEYALWGPNPLPYHTVNILFHGACAVLLWQVLRRLNAGGAWLGAALWALHPVQAESVAWVTELKNTQSGLFFLLAIWFFAKSKTGGQWPNRYYGLTLLCGALAMASKTSTVVLPVVLGLCAWWLDRRWQRRNAITLSPFLFMAVVASGVSIWTQRLEGGAGPYFAPGWAERVAVAGKVVWFYVAKLAWPHPLIFIYPRWQVDAAKLVSYLPACAVLGVLLLFWWKRASWARPAFFASAYYVVALLPVLGLVDHYFLRYSFVGDHFQYLASMGLLPLAAAGIGRLPKLSQPISALLLLLLGLLTWQQARIYHDDQTLWRDTLAKNPGAWMAHNNLGILLQNQGAAGEAVAHYEQALRLKPDEAGVHNNLGYALSQLGKLDEARQHCERALELEPDSADAHNNLGAVFLFQGMPAQAIQHWERALQLKPDYADAHNNLGVLLANQGRLNEAAQHLRQALNLAVAQHNNAVAEAIRGRLKSLEPASAPPQSP